MDNSNNAGKIKEMVYNILQKPTRENLDIIGMNPNNDSHIFEMINKNKNISKVVHYAFGGVDGRQADTIKKIIEHPVEIEDVEEYWKRIR